MEEREGIGVQDFFDLIAFAIKKRKPNIEGSIPTFAELEADVQELWASRAQEAPPKIAEPEPSTPATSEKAQAVATGCVPCSISHLSTCSGLLNEGMRFAREDGIESEEVIDRINMCMDELNALERVDLRPEMIVNLPNWEKTLAEAALGLSRTLRHELSQVSDVSMLEKIAAETQTTRQEIGKAWFRERLSRMTLEQREKVEEELRTRAAEGE